VSLERHLTPEEMLALVDGDLEPEAVARLERHLAGCASCTRELEVYRRLDRAIAGSMDTSPLRGLPEAVFSRITPVPRFPWGDFWRLSPWAAAAFVLMYFLTPIVVGFINRLTVMAVSWGELIGARWETALVSLAQAVVAPSPGFWVMVSLCLSGLAAAGFFLRYAGWSTSRPD